MVQENQEIPKVGQIEPIYDVVGWRVCRTSSRNPQEQEWTATEDRNQAEILSFIFEKKYS
ncbi:MAG: hypothetical protein ACOCT9_00130 [archaeon]